MATSRAIPSTSRSSSIRLFGTSNPCEAAAQRLQLARANKTGVTPTSDSNNSDSSSGIYGTVDIVHLPVLSKQHLNAEGIGRSFRYEGKYGSAISSLAPSRTSKDLAFTKEPTTVLRKAAVDFVTRLGAEEHSRIVFTGANGCGRTTVLLQAMAYCQANQWFICYIADAYKLVDGTYPYLKSDDSEQYTQREAAGAILQDFLKLNKANLKQLDPKVLNEIEAGAKDASTAPAALENLLSSKTRILLAIDGAEALFGQSKYFDSSAVSVPAGLLSVPHVLQAYLLGRRVLAEGAVVAALDRASQFRESLYLGAKSLPVGPLTRKEAAGIYQHLADIKLLHKDRLSDTEFLENYVQSDGNALIFTRGLRAVPVATSRGVLKKGRGRGVPQRDNKITTLSI